MTIKKSLILVIGYGLLIMGLSGCATIPSGQVALPTYNIGGMSYLPLISLCEQKGINWQYDTFTRTITLNKDAHKINLMVGDTLVLVDGLPKHLGYPVDIYQGTVVVPYKFKEQILGPLFKELYPTQRLGLSLSRVRKIIIDAGHGGRDPGAIGRAGLREKDVTLDIAKRLGKILRADGFEVVMTRSSDRFIPLSSRVDIANKSGADIFLSIHANANRVRSLNGFEAYYVSPYVSDSRRALSAAEEAVLNLENAYFASKSLDLKAILWDMIYTYNRAESIELARAICRRIKSDLNREILGIKGASFYVLKGVRMPAVLLEVGFLSNYNEERFLKNSYYRERIADGIKQGLENYAQELALLEAVKR